MFASIVVQCYQPRPARHGFDFCTENPGEKRDTETDTETDRQAGRQVKIDRQAKIDRGRRERFL